MPGKNFGITGLLAVLRKERICMTNKIQFYVRDLACPDCAGKVEQALTRHPGIQSAKVSYATGRITIDYDPAHTDPESIKMVIGGFGYKAVDR